MNIKNFKKTNKQKTVSMAMATLKATQTLVF